MNTKACFAAVLVLLLLPASGTAASQSSTIAYVGCSTTTQAVHGYELAGGTRFWHPPSVFDGRGTLGAYPGGTPNTWALASDHPETLGYWADFERMAKEQPNVSAVWYQVCMVAKDVPGDALANARRIVSILRARFPDATLYVSPMTGYVTSPPFVGDGAERSVALASQLVADGATAGPVLPKLEPDELLPDATHENVAGMWRMGRALLRFFGQTADEQGE